MQYDQCEEEYLIVKKIEHRVKRSWPKGAAAWTKEEKSATEEEEREQSEAAMAGGGGDGGSGGGWSRVCHKNFLECSVMAVNEVRERERERVRWPGPDVVAAVPETEGKMSGFV
ncbi:hypothetical protein Acr_05g0004180 [Actinidia rufa]|uniref:Uncharacterized protein n=1 Tax=Actinidia rufa TaxID=165716 RepID=A0A7J0ELG9_9ERIC|nr:hypothetical protein Acr_05g0004180 [Actinidia rufa]